MIFNERKPVGASFTDLDRARRWDERNLKLESSAEQKAERISRLLSLNPESTVVDLGCGSGFFTLEISRYCKQIYAVDISSIMLQLLEEKKQARGIENITCINKGILQFLSEQKQPVDAFVLQTSLHHLPDFWKSLAVHYIGQNLHSNGLVYLSDVIFSFPISEYKTHFQALHQFISSKNDEGLLRDLETHLLEEHSTFDWVLEGMFERSGFKKLSKTEQSATVAEYLFQKK